MRLLPVALLLLSLPALAQVDARVAYLTRQLEKGKDPRSRSQAALGLGATEEPQALQPLCTALEDPSELVRASAAKGLATLLELSGLECLKKHQEPDAATKVAVREAIQALEAFKSRAPRHYVSFDGLTDKTGALPVELLQRTDERLRRKLVLTGALLAPVKEPKAAALAVRKKRGLPGTRLSAQVQPGEDGGLRIIVVCLSYPEQALLGQVDVQASGAPPADLLNALVPKVIEEVSQLLEWSP